MHPLAAAYLSDAATALLCALAALAALLLFAVRTLRLAASRERVALRILVAGTRGKSTTVRLIAAGLRGRGLRVVARVSGTEPRWIDEAGVEHRWRRRGAASIRELERFLNLAAARRVDAVVVESMAISAPLTAASVRRIVRPGTVVLTNLRADHLEERRLEQETDAGRLAALLPARGARLVVAEEVDGPLLRRLAAGNGNDVTVVADEGRAPLEALRALATAVCGPAAAAGVAGLRLAEGGFRRGALTVAGREVGFFDAFACNDPASLALLWRANPEAAADVVLLNARPDRPLRTRAMLAFLREAAAGTRLFIAGDPLALRQARRLGFPQAELLRERDPRALLRRVAAATPDGGGAWGIGNYRGIGAAVGELLAGEA